MRRAVRFLRDTPCAALLIVQLLGVIVYPFLEGSGAGRAVFSVLGILILGLVLLAVRSTSGLTWVAVLLGEGADNRRRAPVVRPRQCGLGGREGVPAPST